MSSRTGCEPAGACVPASLTQGKNTETNSVTRDNLGMYAHSDSGPGPALMGAHTMLGNGVYNKDGEDLGDIKEFMIDMNSGKVACAGCLSVACSAWEASCLPCPGRHSHWIRRTSASRSTS